MEAPMQAVDLSVHPLTIYHDLLELRSEERTQFIDLTEWVGRSVRRSGVELGIAQLRVLHTTAAIVVNENEPLLLVLVDDDGGGGVQHPELGDAELDSGPAHAPADPFREV